MPATLTIDVSELSGCIAVNAVFLYMYYTFMQIGPSARMSEKSPAQVQWGTRAYGNMHEQAPAFLLSFWSHALVVSPRSAAPLGAAWLVFRATYPLIWMLERGLTPRILCATMPGYGITCYLLAGAVSQACFGVELRRLFFGSSELGVAASTLLFYLHFRLVGLGNELVKSYFPISKPLGRSS